MRSNYSSSLLAFLILLLFSFSASASPLELYRMTGKNPGDLMGSSLACIGRFGTGSTTSDVVVGLSGFGIGGRATAFRGTDGTTTLADIIGVGSSGTLGNSLDFVGDLDQDTFFDFAVGDAGSSAAKIIFGPDGSRTLDLTSTFAGGSSQFGTSVAGLNDDVNDDSHNEVIVGAPLHTGAFGVSGLVSLMNSVSGLPLIEIEGTTDGGALGRVVSGISDYDTDGKRDILASAPGANNNNGQVYIFGSLSGAIIRTINGTSGIGVGYGRSLAAISDQDGDGGDEILVGAPLSSIGGANAGQVRLYSGASGNILCTINGTAGDHTGSSVAVVGDQNFDGRDDFAIGSDGANSNIGKVEIFTYVPSSGSCQLLFTLSGSSAGEKFGHALFGRPGGANICDINGDGFSDFGVGTLDATNGTDSGSAIFYAASRATPTPTPTPTVTPTLTPTPSTRLPSAASFWYRIQTDGTLIARNELNREPHGRCEVTLLGRRTTSDLKQRGRIVTLVKGKKADKVTHFIALKLNKARYQSAGRPYIFHMLVQNQCNGGPVFYSNVYARKLNCGQKPPISISQWETQLANKIN